MKALIILTLSLRALAEPGLRISPVVGQKIQQHLQDAAGKVHGAVAHVQSSELHKNIKQHADNVKTWIDDKAAPKVKQHATQAKMWFQDQAAPQMQKHTKQVKSWVTKDAVPALRKVASQIPLSVKGKVKEIDTAWHNLEPAAHAWFESEALPALSRFAEKAGTKANATKQKFLEFDWEAVPAVVKEYVKAHPGDVAFYVVAGVLFIAPEILFGPVLGVLGWTSLGPAAASFASGLQAAIGPVAGGSIFATLQSAGMGGYGFAVVANLIRGGVVAAIAGKEQSRL